MNRHNWQLWIVFVFVPLGVELVDLAVHHRTLSQQYWAAQDAFPALPYLWGGVVVVLSIHFIWRKWERWGR